MANQWLRLYSEFATDPKIQMMPESYQRRFIMLLCLRCSAVTVTLHDTEVAFQLRISNEEWNETKAVFLSKNLIQEDNTITNWNKRQFASDSCTERVRKHRERMKRHRNVAVTSSDTDTDTDTEEKNTMYSCGEPSKQDVSPRQPVFQIPLSHKDKKGNSEQFKVFQEDIDEWQDSFPAVDVLQALREVRQWNIDNPTKRKTRTGIRKHISFWIGKRQNRPVKSSGTFSNADRFALIEGGAV